MSKLQIMALRHSAFYSPLLLTMAGGFLADEGLDYEYAPATPQRTVPDSIRAGTCHVAQSAVATSFAELERGERPDIVHFAQINERDGFFIAARTPEPDFSWQDLRGRRVLVDHFFQPLAMLKYGLHRAGIALSELQVIDAGDPAAMEAAFRAGEGDYIHLQGPVPQQLAHDGVAHVVAAVGNIVGPVAFSSLCAGRDWLQTDMAIAFMRAYRRSRVFVLEAAPSEIAALELEAGFFPGISREVLVDTIATYQALGCWSVDPGISRESYDRLLEVFLYSGLIHQRHEYDAVIATPPG